jgi:hypothetical protein
VHQVGDKNKFRKRRLWGVMTLVSNRQTFTGNGLQKARISITDRSKYMRPLNKKQIHHANKSQAIVVWRIAVLKRLCL